LLDRANGHIEFAASGFTWEPGHLHKHFSSLEISWAEVARVQLIAPQDAFEKFLTVVARQAAGYLRVFCYSGLLEFSFVLIDAQALWTVFSTYLESGQIEIVQSVVT
jgi:hypothetical protein